MSNRLIRLEVDYMSKPSMFSKDYKSELKKRRRKISLLIILPIIGLTIFLVTDFNALLSKGASVGKSINSVLLNKSKDKEETAVEVEKKPEVVKPAVNSEITKVPQEEVTLKTETFVVNLSDGQKISVEFNVDGVGKSIKGVADTKDITYDISPSGKSIVIQSKNDQQLMYANVDKTSKDITKKTYESSKGEILTKDAILENHENYNWSVMPKFIDEDNIAYISELPWINEKAQQYIWKVNLKSNVYMQVKPASGKNITFNKIADKGLETIIDGNVVYVTSTGEAIE
jgi:ribosome-associated translation inhibitor RaiA